MWELPVVSTYGLVESMRSEFTRVLRPLKGGTSGMATIQRAGTGAQRSTWITGETVAVHYEQHKTDGPQGIQIGVSGAPGYDVFIDGRLDTPLRPGDRIVVNGSIFRVDSANDLGNLTPIASYACMVVSE
jgi:hypothetical protein